MQIQSTSQGKTFEDYITKVDSTFSFANIIPTRVLKLLKSGKTEKAAGIDKIYNKILKLSAPYIYESLSGIFNLSFETNIVPNDWKIARVSPIFKAGDRCDSKHYIPISMISAVARIFEKLVFEQLGF